MTGVVPVIIRNVIIIHGVPQKISTFRKVWSPLEVILCHFWDFPNYLGIPPKKGKLLDCNLLENGEDSFYDFSICYVYDAKRSTYHVFIRSGRIATIPRPAQIDTPLS